MSFGDDKFENILPPYLTSTEKERLQNALKQFYPDNRGNEIDYTKFYKTYQHEYFMQADLLKEIRLAIWDEPATTYNKGYTDAIIISNTCDISFENKRDVGAKECLFAPIVDFQQYLANLKIAGYGEDRIKAFSHAVKTQTKSNIFYLPHHFKEQKEYIALLDNVFWFPTSELNSFLSDIEENRITSLSHFGYYLFILKLSYHLCRLPESCDREINI
jgi:hypothetical protein